MPNLAVFISYIILGAFTPGPNNLLSMSNAGKYGFRRAMRFCLGVFLGFLLITGASAAAGALIMAALPALEAWMRWIGACYILYLAWSMLRSGKASAQEGAGQGVGVFTGMMMQLVNPKVIIYSLTAMTTFVAPYYQSVPALAFFAFVMSFAGAASTVTWAFFGSLFQEWIGRHPKGVNLVFSLLLAWCAVSVVW